MESILFNASWFSMSIPEVLENNYSVRTAFHRHIPQKYGSGIKISSSHSIKDTLFSKKSNPSICSDENASNTISFVVLCRAYVKNQLNVNVEISSKIIKDAIKNGYDTIYSSYR